MSMTLSGNGTITGLVSGGLPDATITSAELASNAVDSQTLTLLHASGSAPVYACRAWVNFNGTGTVAIRASGNVSSITDNGTGDYTVNFTSAMPDENYSAVFGGPGVIIGGPYDSPAVFGNATTSFSTTNIRTRASISGNSYVDQAYLSVSIFR